MHLVVFSHKTCWESSSSPSGYATEGGFPSQMRALSELFDSTTLVVPTSFSEDQTGEIPLTGRNLSIAPLTNPPGSGLRRKLHMSLWVLRNAPMLIREFLKADAVHTPIPGDIGTIGMVLAFVFRKRLFVRYCGNWFLTNSTTKRFLKWFIVRFGGGKNVMMATGYSAKPPSSRNPELYWIFATSLTEEQLASVENIRRLPSEDKIRLITVGRQELSKGTDVLLDVLGLIKKDFARIHLDVVGDGSALPALREKATTLGLEDQVTFHGRVNHGKVIHLLQHADLFCFPTATEGFPKAVLEALACGLPVVTTKVSVLPSLIGNECGVLIDHVSPETIAQAIRTCFSDGKHYHSMSMKAVDTAKQYSLEQWRDTIGFRLENAWGKL